MLEYRIKLPVVVVTAAALAGAGLTGCSHMGNVTRSDVSMISPPPPPPPVPPADSPDVPGKVANKFAPIDKFVIVRGYLPPGGDIVPKDGAPPASVLLLRPGDTAANAAICAGFNQLTEMGSETIPSATSQIPTWWLLKSVTSDLKSCTTLLARYDFERADSLRSAYKLTKLKGAALMLVQSDGRYAALDLSGYDAAQVQKIVKGYFKLIVDKGVTTQAGPEKTAPGDGDLVLHVAQPDDAAPAASGTQAASTDPAKPHRGWLGGLMCDLAGVAADTPTPAKIVGDIGNVICKKKPKTAA